MKGSGLVEAEMVIEGGWVDEIQKLPELLEVNMIDTQVPLFDLHLMLAVNGKERTVAEYSELFERVGLCRIKTTPLENGYVVIEAAAA